MAAPETAGPAAGLARSSLSTMDAVAISVTALAPGMAMLLNIPGVAAVAGGSTPMAFLLGGLACLALALVVVGFTRRMAAAGYAYTYISRSLGRTTGFVAGWLYAFSLICFVPAAVAGTAFLASDLLHLGPGSWFPLVLVSMALLVLLSVVRIKVTTRLQLAVGAITVVVILIVDVVVTVTGGAHGNSAAPFTFAHTERGGFAGVFYGIILGITSYIGFETAADFGEETANPRRSIPIAVIASVVFATVFYLWTTYALTIGFGVDDGAALGADPFALKTLAERFVGGPLAALVEVGATVSAFFVCVAVATAGSRTLFAMGREGALPTWLGRTHRRFRTPANATLTIAVLSTVLAGAVGFGLGSDDLGGAAITVFYFFATVGTLTMIVVYIGLCVGGAVFFRRTGARYSLVVHLLVPAAGVVLFGAALFGSIYPAPKAPLNLAPYITVAAALIGVVVVAVLRYRRPDAVQRIGSILGEEGRTGPGEAVA